MQNMEEIYQEYFKTVNTYLFCLTHDNDMAEELTQETFYRAVTKITTFKGSCKISVWLCQIAKNLWYDEIKRRKRIHKSNQEEWEAIPDKERVEEQTIQKEEKEIFYQRLQTLAPQTREVIELRITGELNFRQIGDIFNKTENWARVTFYRGKQKLKEVDRNEE